MDDIAKTRALLRLVSETDGSVTLSGEAAALVADALAKYEEIDHLREVAQRAREFVSNHPCDGGLDEDRCSDESDLRAALDALDSLPAGKRETQETES